MNSLAKTAAALLVLLPGPALALQCGTPALNQATRAMIPSYMGVVSQVDCAAPEGTSEHAICANPSLEEIATIDTQAYVYSYENATGMEVLEAHDGARDRNADWVDGTWLTATRDACDGDEACLCAAYVTHINDSIGGTSPYTGYKP